MCGIFACLACSEPIANEKRIRMLELSKRLRHRGPDWNGIHIQKYSFENGKSKFHVLCHERLSIVDPLNGAQPLFNEDGTIALAVNGEIYNHKPIREQLKDRHTFKTGSDCEVILHLYEEFGEGCVEKLDGIFAFVLTDSKTGAFLAARDPFGVNPMYIGYGEDGSLYFSSELKALEGEVTRYESFPPGHLMTNKSSSFVRWYNPPWFQDIIPSDPVDYVRLRNLFDDAVKKRLMTDVPYGVLLSGGLDSSLVCSVAARHAAKRVEDNEQSVAWWPRLHTFSIGLIGSPDLKAAREVATFLGTVHHEFNFTVQEGIDAIKDVIYHLESFDVTSIRASTPMYLLSRRIKAMGVKMVLSGEGSDEIFGGYLYFHKAPNPPEFHRETVLKVQQLHLYDNQRANKATAAWGVECRVPFLDKTFVNYAMSVDPKDKMIVPGRIEKYMMRKAFDTPENPYLPAHILWRQKEQFSDGVGYSWIDTLKKFTAEEVTDAMFAKAAERFPLKTPLTKEAYYYREIFEQHYPSKSAIETVPYQASIACSTARAIEWDKTFQNNADPSGRMINVHESSVAK